MDNVINQVDDLIRRTDALQEKMVFPYPDVETMSELETTATKGSKIGETWLADNPQVQSLRMMAAKCAAIPSTVGGYTDWAIIQRDLSRTLRYLKQDIFFVANGQQDTKALEELSELSSLANDLGFAGDSNKAEGFRRRAVDVSVRLFGLENTFSTELKTFRFELVTTTVFEEKLYAPYMQHRKQLQEILFRMQDEIKQTKPNANGPAGQGALKQPPTHSVMYYHVHIVPKTGLRGITFELDLPADEVRSRVAEPYMNGERFFFAGRTIEPDDVEAIHINRTDKSAKEEDMVEAAQRNREASDYLFPPVLGVYQSALGEEVTNRFITRPAPRPAQPSQTTSGPQAPPEEQGAAKPIFLVIDVIILIFFIIWLVAERSWEPGIGVFGGIAALIALVKVPPRYNFFVYICVVSLGIGLLIAIAYPWIVANFGGVTK